MKSLRILLILLAMIMLPNTDKALADDYYYWPEFGTFAQHNNWAAEYIKANQARALGVDGSGVKVAILDDGIADYATEIKSKIVAYKDFVSGQYKLGEHGTMVASTILAEDHPEVGISGVAPGVSLMVGRICHRNGCEWDAIFSGIRWAIENHAQVISMSISGIPQPRIHALLRQAIDKGIVVVGAMGNSGCEPYGYWGLNYSCTQGVIRESTSVGYPIPGLIAVGASDQRGARYTSTGWSSSFGPSLDLIAPGTETSAFDSLAASNGFGGTSSATPLVAATAALLLQADPTLTPSQVQAILQASTTPALIQKAKVWDSCNKNPDTLKWSCNQIVDSTLPQSYYTGAGVLNAYEAVKLAKLKASHKLLAKPNLEVSGLDVKVSWTGSPAEVYVNSQLVASSVSSGFLYTGVKFQSLSIQIKRGGVLSEPELVVLGDDPIPDAPEISNYSSYDGVLYLYLADYSSANGKLWNPRTFGEDTYSGIFELDDGGFLECSGLTSSLSLLPIFSCYLRPGLSSISGTLRVLGAKSTLGLPSSRISAVLQPELPSIEVRTEYLANGKPRFSWQSVIGATSYQIRYQQEYILHCISASTFEVADDLVNPSTFQVTAFSDPECLGSKLAASSPLSYTQQPVKPPKPTGIYIKYQNQQSVEFDLPNRNLTAAWRIYRSDGLMIRINPGQPLMVGMQANEDVNNKTFQYRFAQMVSGTWADAWSELSDPISVTTISLPPPVVNCSTLNRISCKVLIKQEAPTSVIEFLDSDLQVINTVPMENSRNSTATVSNNLGVTFVRTYSAIGEPGTRNSWYRRGSETLVLLGLSKAETLIAQIR